LTYILPFKFQVSVEVYILFWTGFDVDMISCLCNVQVTFTFYPYWAQYVEGNSFNGCSVSLLQMLKITKFGRICNFLNIFPRKKCIRVRSQLLGGHIFEPHLPTQHHKNVAFKLKCTILFKSDKHYNLKLTVINLWKDRVSNVCFLLKKCQYTWEGLITDIRLYHVSVTAHSTNTITEGIEKSMC
jgi:hypothetical protein